MQREIEILLVEDNEGDIVLTIEALKKAKIQNAIHVVRDGDEALDFLKKRDKYINAVTPDIILLDINLPKMDGTEILSLIKKDDHLKIIPVIMLTTSDSEHDIVQAYSNHANCYITKPIDIKSFIKVIRTIKNFWISIVTLPKKTD
ncbi:MAG TPA: response regulator [Flavitalea sp.]|nr:response regulator [Flavitalea sp.]